MIGEGLSIVNPDPEPPVPGYGTAGGWAGFGSECILMSGVWADIMDQVYWGVITEGISTPNQFSFSWACLQVLECFDANGDPLEVGEPIKVDFDEAPY